MLRNYRHATHIALPNDESTSGFGGYIYESIVVLDQDTIAIIQKHEDSNEESGEAIERIDITTLEQLDRLISILQAARSEYTA